MILAAGAGRRYGMPKALALWDDRRTFLEVILDGLRGVPDLSQHQPIVVVGAQSQDIIDRHDQTDVHWVPNTTWNTSDMRASLQYAAHALPTHTHGLIWPVDCPHDSSRTLQKMLDAFHFNHEKLNIIPTFEMQSGHPVLVTSTTLLALPHHASLRELLLAHETLECPVETPAVLRNINTTKSNKYN